MYVFGHSAPRKKHVGLQLLATFVVIVAGLAAAGWYVVSHNAPTHIGTSVAITRTIGTTVGKRRVFDEPAFTFSVPESWSMASNDGTAYYLQPIESTVTRKLAIYMDSKIPDINPANRFLPVRPEVNNISTGTLSGDCSQATPALRKVVWQGFGFTCDLHSGSHSRAVSNLVAVKSTTGATHTFLFTYSDTSATPDFSIMADIVRSVQLK